MVQVINPLTLAGIDLTAKTTTVIGERKLAWET